VLFHFLARTSSKITILHVLRTNIAVNMTKVMINILQGSAAIKTKQDGIIIHGFVANFL